MWHSEKIDTAKMGFGEDDGYRVLSKSDRKLLKRAVRVIIFMGILCTLMLAFFLYLTVQLGKQKDLVHQLEAQKAALEAASDKNLGKRAVLFWLGALVTIANQAFSFYSLATACSEFSESNANKAQCIYGAISTVFTFVGGGYKGYQSLQKIQGRLRDNGVELGVFNKRDLSLDLISSLEEDMSKVIGYPAVIDGWIPHNHPKLHSSLGLNSSHWWPVFYHENHRGTGFHHTIVGMKDTHAMMSLGFGKRKNQGGLIKRETYGDEYFTNGGLDFTYCYQEGDSQDIDYYEVNPDTDFDQMERDVECYVPDLNTANEIQGDVSDPPYGNDLGQTTIRPFDDNDQQNFDDMLGCPYAARTDQCQAA